MSNKLVKSLSELIDAGIISKETAENIRMHLTAKGEKSSSSLIVIFGILGAILAGLGIILIIAHNWDEYSRTVKTILSFLPLIIGHTACGYTLFQKSENTAWREGSSTFLFFAIGACISLISQIYHIPGDITSLLLTWLLLGLPLVYIMRSSMVSLLYIIGITYYGCDKGYAFFNAPENYTYWLLLLLIIPQYIILYRKNSKSNFTLFHHWFVPLSVVITLGTLAKEHSVLMNVAYLILFNLCYLIGKYIFRKEESFISKGYFAIGFLGMVVILIISSFRWFWEELIDEELTLYDVFFTPELLSVVVLFISSTLVLILGKRKNQWKYSDPLEWIFVLYVVIFLMGTSWVTIPVILVNLLVFVIGVYIIRIGANSRSLPILNYGLLVITALIIARFFDRELGFVLRGVLFILVGIGFFIANAWIIKQRKKDSTK